MFNELEFAIHCGESVEDLKKLREKGKLPELIQFKDFGSQYIYAISKSSFIMISWLRNNGITQIFRLLQDAQDNKYLWKLQINYTTLDLSNYY